MTGLPLMVHPHDQALMRQSSRDLGHRGERDFRAYAEAYAAYDGIIWDVATAFCFVSSAAIGTRLHLLHTQTSGVLDRSAMPRPGPARYRRAQPVGGVPGN